jgi:hypothetical protein
MNPIKLQSPHIVVPWESPYVIDSVIAQKENLVSTLRIDFPKKCIWCGDEHVLGFREIYLACWNPKYMDNSKRALMQAGAIAGGLIAGSLGANLVGQGLTYQFMKPEDSAKIKTLYFRVQVPYCALHASADNRGTFELSGLSNDFNSLLIFVRDPILTNEIVQRSDQYVKAVNKDQSVTNNLQNKTVHLSTLEGIVWPDRCVVCGALNPTEKYEVEVDETKVLVPACDRHGQKSLYQKLNTRAMNFTVILGIILLGLGIATFWVQMTTGGHIALCVCGFPAVLALLMFLGRGLIGYITIGIVEGMEDIKGPIEITSKDNTYILKFLKKALANEMYLLNRDKVV